MSMYVVAGMIVASISLVVYAFWPREGEQDDTIKRRIRGGTAASADAVGNARDQAKQSIAKRMLKSVAPLAARPVMMNNPEAISKLRMKLANAGYRSDSAPKAFLASKTIVAVGLGLVVVLYSVMKGDPLQSTAGLVVFAAAIGFMMPNVWLNMAVSKRKGQVRDGLPDTLDLLVISVESGLGLDSALQRVSEEMHQVHPTLAEEMQLVTLEGQMGIPRAEALTNFSARTDLEEVTSLVGVVNQAERFGTSIGKALRNQSRALRTKRRQAAEERAQKTAVKLLLPLILFIFPALGVVLGGPAALTMMETFSNSSAFN